MVKKTRIGFLISLNREEVPKACNLGTVNGVLVGQVFAGLPAAVAGLKKNDLLTSINGIRVDNPMKFKNDLKYIMDQNEMIVFEVYRRCAREKIQISRY